jgi:hypothetical protein
VLYAGISLGHRLSRNDSKIADELEITLTDERAGQAGSVRLLMHVSPVWDERR